MSFSLPVRSGPYGLEVILDRPWDDKVAEFIIHTNASGLNIGAYTSYEPESLEFLADAPPLRLLNICLSTCADDSIIMNLRSLRSLTIDTGSDSSLDFRRLVDLEELSFQWRSSVAGLDACKRLRVLTVYGFNSIDLSPLCGLKSLRKLELVDGSLVSVRGIQSLKELRFLSIAGVDFDDRETLGIARQLRGVAISGCTGLTDLCWAPSLSQLIWLTLIKVGEIASVQPLGALQELEVLGIGEGTVVRDGDLSVLLQMPRLRRVMLVDQPHYSHRSSEFPKDYSRKYDWIWRWDG